MADLIIVESPSKAKTLKNYLGSGYNIIASNGDIIKGCFCGHMHADYYTEIQATTPKGESVTIPQIVLNGAPYNGGNVLKITVN